MDTDQTKAHLEVPVDEDWVDSLAYARGGYGLTKVNFLTHPIIMQKFKVCLP